MNPNATTAANGVTTPVTLGTTRYARVLNNLVRKLRELGAEEIVSLPKIAVIGNQSSGKSSLIEAICQIQVPRASGTCTRCPMEVILRTSDDEEWRARVFLRMEKDQPSGGRTKETLFFANIETREEVPRILRRAQLALLNPQRNVAEMRALDDSACETYRSANSFSRDTVVLEVIGADVDVTLIDLPGLILSHADESVIPTVWGLASSYAEQPDCFILVVTSMKDDMENQGATQIAQRYDRDGKRTIGVLTKADMVSDEDEETWTKIARNETRPLRHGYYITRLAKPEELRENPSWSTIREREREFFANKRIWSASPKIRCGTGNLTTSLSELLAKMTGDSLPVLEENLQNRMRAITAQLMTLPDTLEDDPQPKLLSLCGDFTYELSQFVDGSSNQPEYYVQMKPHFKLLKTMIEETLPVLQSDESQDGAGISIAKVAAEIDKRRIKDLPGEVPHSVYQAIIHEFVPKWEMISLKWFSRLEIMTLSFLSILCEKHFKNYRTYGLRNEVRIVTEEVLRQVGQETQKQITFFCQMEKQRSFILNDQDYLKQYEKFEADIAAKLSVDPTKHATELRIIANVYSYFEIASKRFIEAVPMICEVGFAKGLGEVLRKQFVKMLGLTGTNGLQTCAKFAQEEPATRDRRQFLQRSKRIVEESLKALDEARSL